MVKETWLSALRTVLVIAGTWLIGHNLFGAVVDASIWQEIVGGSVALGAAIWGVVDKSGNVEGLQSAVRSFLAAAGSLLVASGKISGDTLNGIIALVSLLIPILLSGLGKAKVVQINNGTLTTNSDGSVTKKAA